MTTREFDSFDALARHFSNVIRRLPGAERRALNDIGSQTRYRARAKLGNYQPEVPIPPGEGEAWLGSFPAWRPLAPSTLAEKTRLGYSPPDNPLVRDRTMYDSIGYEVVRLTVTIGATAPYAVYQELGTSRMPPRPFIGPALVETLPYAMRVLTDGIRAAFEGAR
jgi:HK97 gp10 family phage protein